MPLALRPIAALAVVGALSLLAAGCSAADDGGPSPSPTRSSTPSQSATTTATPTPTSTPTEGTGDDATPTPDPSAGAGGQTDPDPGTFPATALVTFTTWDRPSSRLQAAGLVSGTTDASGTCTFTATMGGVSRTVTSAASGSASSVNCAQAEFAAGQITSGTWNVTLTYAVGGKSTVSAPMAAQVP
jgi:hypothetical protein